MMKIKKLSQILSVLKILPINSQLPDYSTNRSEFQVAITPIWNNSTASGMRIKPFPMRSSAFSLAFLTTKCR